jgi:hypothetical protein
MFAFVGALLLSACGGAPAAAPPTDAPAQATAVPAASIAPTTPPAPTSAPLVDQTGPAVIAGAGITPADGPDNDVAVMDDFIYGEPQAVP